MSTHTASIISQICGWGYFVAWSSSMYPQPILNYRRHSIDGLSIDFVWLAWLGFKFYSIYALSFFMWPAVRNEYKNRNDGHENLVTIQDVIFAIHCWAVTGFVGCQVLYYRKKHHRLSWVTNLVTVAIGAGVIGLTIWARVENWNKHALDVVNALGYSKMALTFAKYVPQAWINFRDKSTEGWSSINVMADLVGSVLGLCQLILDAWIAAQEASQPSTFMTRLLRGNASKLGLGLVCFVFDITFLVQHFCLYRGRPRFHTIEATKEKEIPV